MNSLGQCVDAANCGNGWFADASSNKCVACTAGCTKCSNKDTCDICYSGFQLNILSKKCTACKGDRLGDCATCAADKCTKCNGQLFISTKGACVEKCFANEFAKNGACTTCLGGCAACSDEKTCTSCKDSF